jgi:hypothetical protein
VNTAKLKVAAATAGATGVLAMGALTVAFSGSSVAEPTTPGPVQPPEPTLAQTSTETTAPPTPTTTFAEPSITGPAPLPPEQAAA